MTHPQGKDLLSFLSMMEEMKAKSPYAAPPAEEKPDPMLSRTMKNLEKLTGMSQMIVTPDGLIMLVGAEEVESPEYDADQAYEGDPYDEYDSYGVDQEDFDDLMQAAKTMQSIINSFLKDYDMDLIHAAAFRECENTISIFEEVG